MWSVCCLLNTPLLHTTTYTQSLQSPVSHLLGQSLNDRENGKDWQFWDGWHLCIMVLQTSWFGCKWSSSSVSESAISSIWLAPEDCNLCGLVLSFLNAQQTQKASFVWWGKGWTIPQGCCFALDWPAACLVHHSYVQKPVTRCVPCMKQNCRAATMNVGWGVNQSLARRMAHSLQRVPFIHIHHGTDSVKPKTVNCLSQLNTQALIQSRHRSQTGGHQLHRTASLTRWLHKTLLQTEWRKYWEQTGTSSEKWTHF